MSAFRALILTGVFLWPLVPASQAQSWLQGPSPVAAPEATSSKLLGLELQEQVSLRYHHPFAVVPTQQIRKVTVKTAEPGGIYLLRTAPGPQEAVANKTFLQLRQREVMGLGFQWLAAPPRGGAPFTPLMGIVRFNREAPLEVPSWIEIAPVSGAKVHLAMLHLDALGKESWEAPIAISEELPPVTAIRRAWSIYRTGMKEWGQGGRITTKELGTRWPKAAAAMASKSASEDGLMLAIRVIWTSGDQEIPGPGGMSIHAVHPHEAHRRLQLLYAPSGS